MRNVLLKKWIPAKFPEGTNSSNKFLPGFQKIKGTGCWTDDFVEKGKFHQWAHAYEELNQGVGIYMIAIVELEDGTIVESLLSKIKFID